MRLFIDKNAAAAEARAAARIVRALVKAQKKNGAATLVVGTLPGTSAALEALARDRTVDWGKVAVFQAAEYLGLGEDHPSGFGRTPRERFVERLPVRPAAFYEIDPTTRDPAAECRRLNAFLAARPVDAALLEAGGEGELALNAAGTAFGRDAKAPGRESAAAYESVSLDVASRRRLAKAGVLTASGAAPEGGIGLSLGFLLGVGRLVCVACGAERSRAVCAAVEGALTPSCPASALRLHRRVEWCLDAGAAGKLSPLARLRATNG